MYAAFYFPTRVDLFLIFGIMLLVGGAAIYFYAASYFIYLWISSGNNFIYIRNCTCYRKSGMLINLGGRSGK